MMDAESDSRSLRVLDDSTRALVRLAAVVAAGTETDVRAALASAHAAPLPGAWIEELLLQTYLFAGFPRALNAMREWRRIAGPVPAETVTDRRDANAIRANGEAVCRAVYGAVYDRLRDNIRGLHPLLDDWMVTEGYGKVLSRAGLDLGRRELCIVAACAASGQERQLHSHLHGAINVGVAPTVVDAGLEALHGVVAPENLTAARLLWLRVKGK